MKNKLQGKVDLLDLVNVTITRLPPNGPEDLVPLAVDIVPYDKHKRIVFDENSLKTLNFNITEKVKHMELDYRNPQTLQYVKEFVGRMVSELYRNGLIELEVIPDTKEDPYEKARKWQLPN